LSCCKSVYSSALIRDYLILSSGLLKPPRLFIYCRHVLVFLILTVPSWLPSTCFPFVDPNPVTPIIVIIAASSSSISSMASPSSLESGASGSRFGRPVDEACFGGSLWDRDRLTPSTLAGGRESWECLSSRIGGSLSSLRGGSLLSSPRSRLRSSPRLSRSRSRLRSPRPSRRSSSLSRL